MRLMREHAPPEDVRASRRRATVLEWITIAYLLSAIVLLYLVLGSSQAMRAAWFEDLLSLVPPVTFLIVSRVVRRPPDERFPFGYHRAIAIGHLTAGLALFGMGAYLLLDSLRSLLSQHHPTIGTMVLFGEPIWLGWLMIPALVWTGAPAVILGRLKLPLAEELDNKLLDADADMNKADWTTAGAAILGILGVGLGFWWADAVAAGLISLDILKDGVQNTVGAVTDLMDQRPTTVGRERDDPLIEELEAYFRGLPWVERAELRLRELGELVVGEVFLTPRAGTDDLPERLIEAQRGAEALDWRAHDLALMLEPARASAS